MKYTEDAWGYVCCACCFSFAIEKNSHILNHEKKKAKLSEYDKEAAENWEGV